MFLLGTIYVIVTASFILIYYVNFSLSSYWEYFLEQGFLTRSPHLSLRFLVYGILPVSFWVPLLSLQSENTRNLYAIPGLDYVAHEDILPYKTEDKSPIQHELFDKFLSYQENAGKTLKLKRLKKALYQQSVSRI